MTICMVIEFSNRFQQYYTETWYQTLTAAYGFVDSLKPDDYVAIVAYDLRPPRSSPISPPTAATPRTRSLASSSPPIPEANLFDALVDTAQRMQDIEGRKAILVISTGIDTFSKLNYDETRKAIQNSQASLSTQSD